jgi:molybdopterin/thiamine biosynthesis adenylyltransferase
MSYDDKPQHTNELNINDAKVKDRWSRYIGALGIEAVAK